MLVIYGILVGYITFFIQKSKIFDKLFFNELLKYLRACTLCLGFWISLLIYPLFRITIFDDIVFPQNIILKIELIILHCIVLSTIIHYFRKGWSTVHDIQRL